MGILAVLYVLSWPYFHMPSFITEFPTLYRVGSTLYIIWRRPDLLLNFDGGLISRVCFRTHQFKEGR